VGWHVNDPDLVRSAGRRRARSRHWRPGAAVAVGALGAVTVSVFAVGGFRVVRADEQRPAGVAGDGCPAGRTALVVASSAEKAGLMTSLAADFSRQGRDAAGRCVQVSVVTKSSGAAQTALAAGWPASAGPRPDVWCPSGSIWLGLLEQRLAAGQRSSLIPDPESVPSLATSPMVVAMPRPMAQALGWPDRPIGWSDLLGLAKDGTGWAKYGHPEWGTFSLGKTNPNFSHAGLEATIATFYAAVGRRAGLTQADLDSARTRTFVAGVEQAVVRYGDNTASFLSDWQRADDAGQALSYMSAVVTEENTVPAYNEGNPTANPALAGAHPAPRVPLVSVYPKEGTFVANHPYAVLSQPWVDQPKRDAAAAFLAYLLSPPVQQTWQKYHFRDARGHAGPAEGPDTGVLPAQPASTLAVPPPVITDAVLDRWAQLRKTANVISLIDVSGSMAARIPGQKATKLDAAKQAAVASLDLFTDHDQVGLWSFSGGTGKGRDWTPLVEVGPMNLAVGPVVRRRALQQELAQLKATSGDTGLYNTIGAAYRAVLDRYRADQINAIVVLTDGRNDALGGLTLDQLLQQFKTTTGGRQVRVITIGYGPDVDQPVLAQIARATKGAAYQAATPADIPKIYSQALSNL
jgi:Ca-activated chloride channel homolog